MPVGFMIRSMKVLQITPLLLSLYAVQAQQDPECTPCADGFDPFDLGPVCSNAVDLTQEQVGGTPECSALQLVTFQAGCCDTPPENYCTLCENGSQSFNADKVIPRDAQAPPGDFTCAMVDTGIRFIRNIDTIPGSPEVYGACDFTERERARAWCECEGAQPACELRCDDGNPPPDLQKADPVQGKTCERMMYEYTLLTADECQTPSESLNFDAKAFCCNEPEPDNCSICVSGTALTSTAKEVRSEFFGAVTCGEIDTYASYLPDDACVSFIRELLDDPFGGEAQCCDVTSSAPSVASGLLLLLFSVPFFILELL